MSTFINILAVILALAWAFWHFIGTTIWAKRKWDEEQLIAKERLRRKTAAAARLYNRPDSLTRSGDTYNTTSMTRPVGTDNTTSTS